MITSSVSSNLHPGVPPTRDSKDKTEPAVALSPAHKRSRWSKAGLASPFMRLCVLRLRPGFLARGSERDTAPLLGGGTTHVLPRAWPHSDMPDPHTEWSPQGWPECCTGTGFRGNGNLEERSGVGWGAVIRGSELAEGTQASQGCSMLGVNLPTSAEAAIQVSSIQH